MLTIDALQAFGANVTDGMTRCLGREDFYLRLVRMIPSDRNFERLADAIGTNDLAAAFEAAHALKGVLANLSLTPILTPTAEMTELLRARTETDYAPLLDEVLRRRDELRALCAD